MIHTRWFTLQPGFQQQSVSFLELIKDGGFAEDAAKKSWWIYVGGVHILDPWA